MCPATSFFSYLYYGDPQHPQSFHAFLTRVNYFIYKYFMYKVLVTGGTKGIGLAISERLAASGHQVFTCARGAGATFQCDVTVVSDVERMRSQSGPVDILINNAGGALSAPFLKTSAADLDRQLALNLKSAFTAPRRTCRR